VIQNFFSTFSRFQLHIKKNWTLEGLANDTDGKGERERGREGERERGREGERERIIICTFSHTRVK
jgi:hypothetical protein